MPKEAAVKNYIKVKPKKHFFSDKKFSNEKVQVKLQIIGPNKTLDLRFLIMTKFFMYLSCYVIS